ncbi:MAG: translation initiation factor eIF-1A [Methanospirillaceae archaeon]|nr:translation initiation factor eIF-1A [Methanospirillaceae archaeon]
MSTVHTSKGPVQDEPIRVRLPRKNAGEQFACAELMLGAYHIRVKCSDGVTRLGRIKGKIKKRAWIREGDIVIVTPWSFQDDKCDISYRYTPPQKDWLRRNQYLK